MNFDEIMELLIKANELCVNKDLSGLELKLLPEGSRFCLSNFYGVRKYFNNSVDVYLALTSLSEDDDDYYNRYFRKVFYKE